jgi:hypothetical protein
MFLHVLGVLALLVLPVMLPPARPATHAEKSSAVTSNGVVSAQH